MLWMITDMTKTPDVRSAIQVVSQAFDNGAEKVTLRNKESVFTLGQVVDIAKKLSEKYPSKEIFLHDVDPCSVSGHTFFHLSSPELEKAIVLKRSNPFFTIAVSTHNEKEFTEAFSNGIDYAFFSPVFKPLSKPEDKRKRVEPVMLKNLYLLGGIDRMRGVSLVEKGYTNLAGVSLFYGDSTQEDVFELANLIKEKENEVFDTN
jgi:thiamine monophosphate synthase